MSTEASPTESAAGPASEARVQEIGRALINHARGGVSGLFSPTYWSDRVMNRAMNDDAFKDALLRLVDVFPTLHDHHAVYDYLADYAQQEGVTPPRGMRFMLRLARMTGTKRLLAWTATKMIRITARRFIAGVDARESLPALRRLWNQDTAFTVTLLGESCANPHEATAFQQGLLSLLRELADATETWPAGKRAEHNHLGPIPRVSLSLKLSSLYPIPKPTFRERGLPGVQDAIVEKLTPLLEAARDAGVQLHFDMEWEWMKDLVFNSLMHCAERFDVRLGVVLQCYLRSAEDDARKLVAWARQANRQITVRLVKGAYYDQENALAAKQGRPAPVWSVKHESDACFERVARILIEATPRMPSDPGIVLALGSHNVRSVAAVLALLEEYELPETAVELQMLYGMADELMRAATRLDLRVRAYVPIGEMLPGMAYFARRLLENTANESFVRPGFMHSVPPDELLASPHRS